MKYQAYDRYKDSGVPWLGDIPDKWEVIKLRFLCNIKTGTKDTENNIESGEYPFFVRSDTVEKIDSYGYDGEAVLTAGDGVGVGKVFHYHNGKFDFHQRVYAFTDFKKITGKYFYLVFSQYFKNQMYLYSAKSTVDSVRMPFLQEFIFSIPSIQEQISIVAYLDKKTAEIDVLIGKKEALLKALAEKRTAIITHAVTKGLNPTAPMKESGIDWLGQIPAHWDVKPMKRCLSIQNGRDYKEVETDSGYPVIGSGGQFTFASDYLYSGEAVLLGRKGTIDKPLYIDAAFWTVDTMYYAITNSNSSAKFLYYCALGIPFSLYSTDTALPSMTQTALGNHPIATPCHDEQKAIAAFLDEKTVEINSITQKIKDAISKLKEYRTSLITNAVTGKIKVA
jgi:type I restriction enzyme, S subunit